MPLDHSDRPPAHEKGPLGSSFGQPDPTTKKLPNISYTRENPGAYVEHETRFELAFPSTPLASHTRRSLIARVSPFRWQRVAIVEFIDVYQVYRA